MPSGFAPYHPPATMQKHEKKRVAGGACCICLKAKGQICARERGNLEVASDSWRGKEEEKGMKWTGGGGRKCGKHRTYGSSFSSICSMLLPQPFSFHAFASL